MIMTIMAISLRLSFRFYLEFADKFKSSAKYGRDILYNKLEI